MNAKATACPPKNLLSDFGLGKLDDRAAETLSEHLETCDECRRMVDRMEGDSFVQRMREAVGPQSPASPAESVSNAASSAEIPTTGDAGPAPLPAGDQQAASVSLPRGLADSADFEVIKVLGQGGMGVVHLARNRMMDRLEVLKVVNKSLLDRPGSLERFQQEIRAAARLLHPNIVAAHSVPRLGDLLVFAMEYVDGQDLSQVVKRRGPLPVTNATFYAHQVAVGLQHAHEKGMVHRDIKPSNLMLAIEGKKHVVKILDFGLAKATSEKAAEVGLTQSGQILGTPGYIAPEQTLDAHKAGIRADIYSLGCTLYFLLSGHPPFQGASMYEILQAHHQTQAQPLNLVRSDVPAELAAVVSKMLAKNPAQRYQTPAEVAKALGPFFKAGAPTGAKADLPPTAAALAQPAAPLPVAAAAPVSPAIEPRAAALGPRAVPPEPRVSARGAVPHPGADTPGSTRIAAPAATQPRKQTKPNRRRLGPALAIGLLMLGVLGAAAIIFKFKTSDGIVVVTVNVPGAEVLMDGSRMIVTWADGGKRAEIRVPPGSHQIELKKDGFQAYGQTVSISSGGEELVTARLDPLVGWAPPTKAGPNPVGSAAGTSRTTPINPEDSRPPHEPLHAYRERIKAAWPGREDRLRIDEQNHLVLDLDFCQEVHDLKPLAGMRLNWLSLRECKDVADISPLHGMPLTYLSIANCRDLTSLEPLKGMPLEELRVVNVRDLRPLAGLSLRRLRVYDSAVTDLSPLKGMPLEEVQFWGCGALRDLTPLKGMKLTRFDFSYGAHISDLTLLTGMPLNALHLDGDSNQVQNLSPLRGLSLNRCFLRGCVQVTDFTPLAGMPLAEFAPPTTVSNEDLRLFKDVRLTCLDLMNCSHVTNLAPTAEMPLERLHVGGCERLSDLAPLAGKKLKYLFIYRTAVTDLTPLRGMALVEVRLTPSNISTGLDILRAMPSLRFIGIGENGAESFAASEFWKRYDAGEFTTKPPAAVGVPAAPYKWPAGTPAPAIAPFDAKRARVHQDAWAKYLGVPVEQTNSIGMKLVLIPPGEFMMGSTPEQAEAKIKIARQMGFTDPGGWQLSPLPEEQPRHRVAVTKPYQIGATEVTVGHFKQFCTTTKFVTAGERLGFGNSPAITPDSNVTPNMRSQTWRAPGYLVTDNSPVSEVTWNDAVAFCNWLSEREKLVPCYRENDKDGWVLLATGDGYRLPTEAEWECACRAGTTTQFYFGDDFSESRHFVWSAENAQGGPGAVATKLPNAFGLFDMHGNLKEWCGDWFAGNYYRQSPPSDPSGLVAGSIRSARSGAWAWKVFGSLSSSRQGNPPTLRQDCIGFRVARAAAAAPIAPSPATVAGPFANVTDQAGSKPDPIGARLAKAKEVYEHKIQSLRDGVAKALERREGTVRANGDKKLVDQIKAEREAFESSGKLPTLVPSGDYARQLAGARTQLETAYNAAIKAYTKAALDDRSTAVESELAKFRKGPAQ